MIRQRAQGKTTKAAKTTKKTKRGKLCNHDLSVTPALIMPTLVALTNHRADPVYRPSDIKCCIDVRLGAALELPTRHPKPFLLFLPTISPLYLPPCSILVCGLLRGFLRRSPLKKMYVDSSIGLLLSSVGASFCCFFLRNGARDSTAYNSSVSGPVCCLVSKPAW